MQGESGWPLAGLRVIDLSTEIAGPYCTKLLVDAGADVVKVESPQGGDPLRRWSASGATLGEGEDGALFQHLNASKRSLTADLASTAGGETVLETQTLQMVARVVEMSYGADGALPDASFFDQMILELAVWSK